MALAARESPSMPNTTIITRLRDFWRGDKAASQGATGRGTLIPFKRKPRAIALALQGGGAHGAFTWGALDRVLEDQSLEIEALSGASAGAINAAVLASAYAEGGASHARTQLTEFWLALVKLARMSPLRPTALEAIAFGRDMELAASSIMRDMISRVVSPYQFNPLDVNPLRQLLGDFVNVEALKEPSAIRLIVAATNAETGAARLFTNEELTLDVLLASACLPSISQAVRIDDGYYWDGGFSSNPPLLALIEKTTASDVVIVRLNPEAERGLPVTAPKIQSRVNRIVFDAPLKRELDELDRLRRVTSEAGAQRTALGRRLARLKLHTIGEDELMTELGAASQLHPDAKLIERLYREGRASCERWLTAPAARMSEPQAVTAG
jgi:NTE family protein